MTTGAAGGIRTHVLAELNDFPLGAKLTERLASWGIVTVDDLTKVGWYEERVITDEDRPALRELWRGYVPGLCEIKGIGWVTLTHIRRWLAEYDLTLADEDKIKAYEERVAASVQRVDKSFTSRVD